MFRTKIKQFSSLIIKSNNFHTFLVEKSILAGKPKGNYFVTVICDCKSLLHRTEKYNLVNLLMTGISKEV